MNPLFGLNIIEARVDVVPKIKLSDKAPVSDEFRAEFNAWLVEMFGTKEVGIVPPGMAYVFGGNVVMRPEAVAQLINVL